MNKINFIENLDGRSNAFGFINFSTFSLFAEQPSSLPAIAGQALKEVLPPTGLPIWIASTTKGLGVKFIKFVKLESL